MVKNSPALNLINVVGGLCGLIVKLTSASRGVRGEVSWATSALRRQRQGASTGKRALTRVAVPKGRRSAGTAGLSSGKRRAGVSFADVAAGRFVPISASPNGASGRNLLARTEPPSKGFKSTDGLRASLGRLTAKPRDGTAFVVQAYHSLGWVKGAGFCVPLSSLRRLYAGKLVVTRTKTMRSILEKGMAVIRGDVATSSRGPAAKATAGDSEAPTSAVSAVVAERALAKAVAKTAKAAKPLPEQKASRSRLLSRLSKREVALAARWWSLTDRNADRDIVERGTSFLRTRLRLDALRKGRRARLARYILRCADRLRQERRLADAVAQSPPEESTREVLSQGCQVETSDFAEDERTGEAPRPAWLVPAVSVSRRLVADLRRATDQLPLENLGIDLYGRFLRDLQRLADQLSVLDRRLAGDC